MHGSDDQQLPESKSLRKRQMLALQKMGESLIHLSDLQLSQLILDSALLNAIQFAKTVKSHGGLRRHLQLIGKLMRHTDATHIEEQLKILLKKDKQGKAKFHQIERWRDVLIGEGDTALDKFITEYPDTDRQQLRTLVRNAQQELKNEKDLGGSTQLFRYLRTTILGAVDNTLD